MIFLTVYVLLVYVFAQYTYHPNVFAINAWLLIRGYMLLCVWVLFKCLNVRLPNDEGSQFSKFRFPWNKEEKLVSNSFFREYNLYLKKTLNPFKAVLHQSAVCYISTFLFPELTRENYFRRSKSLVKVVMWLVCLSQ